jgi:hypothetical protein
MTMTMIQQETNPQDTEDARDQTIVKLLKQVESMDMEKESFLRNIAGLEDQVHELGTLKEAYESKIEAFESLFRSMNEEESGKRESLTLTDTESSESSFSSVDSEGTQTTRCEI